MTAYMKLFSCKQHWLHPQRCSKPQGVYHICSWLSWLLCCSTFNFRNRMVRADSLDRPSSSVTSLVCLVGVSWACMRTRQSDLGLLRRIIILGSFVLFRKVRIRKSRLRRHIWSSSFLLGRIGTTIYIPSYQVPNSQEVLLADHRVWTTSPTAVNLFFGYK